MGGMTFHHVVLFRLHDEAAVAGALAVLEASRPREGLLDWRVERSLDDRKGPVVVEVAVFDGRASYDAFVRSPAHRAAGAHLAEVADWLVGDFEGPPRSA